MKMSLRMAAAGVLLLAPAAAFAGFSQSSVPELDPSMIVAGLALAGGAAALVIERFRNRKK